MKEILKKIADPKIGSQIEKVARFHGYLSTGAFAGIQMLSIARRVLDASEGDRLFVACETWNCLPDLFQALDGTTVENKWLRIMERWRSPAGTKVKVWECE